MDKKKMLIGGLVLVAVIGGYVWYSKHNKKAIVSTTPTNPLAKYEGKNIAEADANGVYAGGAVYLVKNGKKLPYGNNTIDTGNGLNWDTYVAKNGDDVILVSKTVVDSIPNA